MSVTVSGGTYKILQLNACVIAAGVRRLAGRVRPTVDYYGDPQVPTSSSKDQAHHTPTPQPHHSAFQNVVWCGVGWLGSRVVSVLDSGAAGPGFKSQSRRCRVTVLGKLLTPIVPLFAKQQNW